LSVEFVIHICKPYFFYQRHNFRHIQLMVAAKFADKEFSNHMRQAKNWLFIYLCVFEWTICREKENLKWKFTEPVYGNRFGLNSEHKFVYEYRYFQLAYLKYW